MTRMTGLLGEPRHLFSNLRIILICALGLLAFGSFAGSAAAATSYCVVGDSATDCPLGSQIQPSIPAAVAASGSSSATTLYVTSGTHVATTGFDLDTKPIRMIGVGPSRPVITSQVMAPGGAVLRSLSSLTDYENIAVGIPAGADQMTGIRASVGGQSITNVNVNGSAATASTGIEIAGAAPTLANVDVTLDGSLGSSTAVQIDGSTTARLLDVELDATANGVAVSDSLDLEIRRTKITADNGVVSTNSTGTVSSSLIVLPQDASGVAISAHTSDAASHNLDVFSSTLVHPGGVGTTGVRSSASGGGSSQHVRVDSSIISGFGYLQLQADSSAGASATLEARYTWFGGPNPVADDITLGTGNRINVTNYGLVDAAGGNYRPRLDSPVVDAGNPIAGDFGQADSETDLDGNSRVVARKGGRVRDVGAYEVQNSAPVAVIDIVGTPSTTAPTRFSAARSSDAEGDALSFSWSFDSVPGFGGASASKWFMSPGPHTVRLSVSDSNGSVAHAVRQFEVEPGYLKMTIRSQRVRLAANGTFALTLSCPAEAASDCTGKLDLQTASRIDAKRYKKKRKKSKKRKSKRANTAAASYLKVADYVFRVAPGVTKSVVIPTTQTFRTVLAAKKQLEITSVVSGATTINAILTSNRATHTVLAPKRR